MLCPRCLCGTGCIDAGKRILDTKRFVFFHPHRMIGKNIERFHIGQACDKLSQIAKITFLIRVTRHKHMPDPNRYLLLCEIVRKSEDAGIAVPR